MLARHFTQASSEGSHIQAPQIVVVVVSLEPRGGIKAAYYTCILVSIMPADTDNTFLFLFWLYQQNIRSELG